jgi:ubiquinone/menaquinone biosynthesis C-methylase UbiE
MSKLERLKDLQIFFDRAACEWANQPFDLSFVKKLLQPAGLHKGDTVLDLGCGTGHLLPVLDELVGSIGKICALDLSFQMLTHIPKSIYSSVFRIHGAAEALPLRDLSLDAVIGMGIYPHFTSPEAALTEIKRVLKLSGRLVILHTIGRKELNALHQQVGGVIATDILPEGSEVAKILESTGFWVEEVADSKDYFRVLARRA